MCGRRRIRLRHVFSVDQRAAVTAAFSQASYDGPLKVAPVTSEDERVFLLSPQAFASLRDKTRLERTLQQLLRRKVWIVAQTEQWADGVPFH